jgi:hypothetical protein
VTVLQEVMPLAVPAPAPAALLDGTKDLLAKAAALNALLERMLLVLEVEDARRLPLGDIKEMMVLAILTLALPVPTAQRGALNRFLALLVHSAVLHPPCLLQLPQVGIVASTLPLLLLARSEKIAPKERRSALHVPSALSRNLQTEPLVRHAKQVLSLLWLRLQCAHLAQSERIRYLPLCAVHAPLVLLLREAATVLVSYVRRAQYRKSWGKADATIAERAITLE